MTREYTFIDHWYINAPIDEVFAHIADPRTYPQWWPSYDRVELINPPHGGNPMARLTVKSGELSR